MPSTILGIIIAVSDTDREESAAGRKNASGVGRGTMMVVMEPGPSAVSCLVPAADAQVPH